MTATLWQPGTPIDVRTIWHGRLHSAHPAFVVEDARHLLVTYLAPGQMFKRAFHADGSEARVPHGEWTFRDEVWRVPALRIFMSGEAHSILAFLDGDRVGQWYVNLEDPPTRTSRGIDTRDHMVDVWFSNDRSEYRWKDLDELDRAQALGVVDLREATNIRREGERVIELISIDAHPAIDDRWQTWRPPVDWGIPTLTREWERLRPMASDSREVGTA